MAMSITWWSLVNSPWSRDLGGAVLVGRRLWRRRPWLGWLMLPLETPLGHIEGSIRQSTTTPALHPDKHLPAPPIFDNIIALPVMREVEVIVMMGMRVCQSCQTSGWSQDGPSGLLAGHVPIHLCPRPTPQYAGDEVINGRLAFSMLVRGQSALNISFCYSEPQTVHCTQCIRLFFLEIYLLQRKLKHHFARFFYIIIPTISKYLWHHQCVVHSSP